MTDYTKKKIGSRLRKIKEKHKEFEHSKALAILIEEVGEIGKEIQEENNERLKDELLDAIAFGIRWYEEL